MKDNKIVIDDEHKGKYSLIWLEPRGYYWGQVELLFAKDVEDDASSAKFKFLQRKRLSAEPANIQYDWPAQPETDIIDVDRVFYGPTKPDKSMLKFECEKEVYELFKQMK